MSDTKRLMAKGAVWMVTFKLIERGIGLLSTLILARLLFPADFGLVAMASSVIAALELLSAFSFDLALIHNQKAGRQHYDTAWTFNVLFGLFNAVVMIAIAVPVSSFYGEPRVTNVLYALAACSLIQGFDNIGIIAFQKNLELHKEFLLGLSKKLTGFAVTISLAFWLQNYWALVAGIFSARIVSLVLSYALHPFRPRFSFAAAQDLIHFSKWLLLNNILIFLNNRGTDFIIGRISGAQALGIYAIAYEMANLPTTELVFPISRAIFPGYARLASDPEKLREAFLQVLGILALLTIPAGAGIGLVAEPFVQSILGTKWMDAVPLIQVLAVFGIIRALHGPNGSIYLALGKPKIVAALQCVQLSIAITLMFFLVPQFGAIGAAWAILIGASVAMTASFAMVLRELKISFAHMFRVVWRPLSATFSMCSALIMLMGTWPDESGFSIATIRLIVLIAVGVITYLVAGVLCWLAAGRPEGAELQLFKFVAKRLRPSS